MQWEMLHWFLKFLIPKLIVKDPTQEHLDQLLESIDLSTYGLERVKLNHAITLDANASELDPQNPNSRGFHDEIQEDPLDEIIAAFNDRFFTGWNATPAEQKVKFMNIIRHITQNPNYQSQVVNNKDEQNRHLAFEQLMKQAMNQGRKQDLELYKRYASDPDFKRAFDASIMMLLSKVSQQDLQSIEA